MRRIPSNKSLHWPPGGTCHVSCRAVILCGTNRARCLAPVSLNVRFDLLLTYVGLLSLA